MIFFLSPFWCIFFLRKWRFQETQKWIIWQTNRFSLSCCWEIVNAAFKLWSEIKWICLRFHFELSSGIGYHVTRFELIFSFDFFRLLLPIISVCFIVKMDRELVQDSQMWKVKTNFENCHQVVFWGIASLQAL